MDADVNISELDLCVERIHSSLLKGSLYPLVKIYTAFFENPDLRRGYLYIASKLKDSIMSSGEPSEKKREIALDLMNELLTFSGSKMVRGSISIGIDIGPVTVQIQVDKEEVQQVAQTVGEWYAESTDQKQTSRPSKPRPQTSGHPHGYEPNQGHVTSSGATIHRKKKL